MNSRPASSEPAAPPARQGTLLRRIPDPSDRRPLVIAFPYAGGGAAAYAEWRDLLDADCAVLPVHLPGRERRFQERPYRRMTHLVRDLVAEVGPHMDRRVVFWGHSMGASVAVALSLELARQGFAPPAHILVSGAGSPDRRDLKDLIHVLDDERLTARLHRYDGTPREVLDNPDLLALVLPVIRADFEIIETWVRPRPAPLPAPLTVLYGKDDQSVSAYRVAGWPSYSNRPVDPKPFDGGHFFIREHAAEVAGIIRALATGPDA